MKKFDIVALGEVLIDYTDNGMSAQKNTLFEPNQGGAHCNVLAVLRKLGHSAVPYITTKKGALRLMPYYEEVQGLIMQRKIS